MPNEATVVVAAIYTVSDDLALLPVLVVAWTAAVVGESAAFAIGRYGGRPLAIRLGRRFGVTHDLLDRVEGFYERRGITTVVLGRFVPILRRLNGLVAGVTAMTWQRFLIANAIGAAIWVGVWTTVGTQAGNHIEAVNTAARRGRTGLRRPSRAPDHRLRHPAATPTPEHDAGIVPHGMAARIGVSPTRR